MCCTSLRHGKPAHPSGLVSLFLLRSLLARVVAKPLGDTLTTLRSTVMTQYFNTNSRANDFTPNNPAGFNGAAGFQQAWDQWLALFLDEKVQAARAWQQSALDDLQKAIREVGQSQTVRDFRKTAVHAQNVANRPYPKLSKDVWKLPTGQNQYPGGDPA